MEQTGGEGGSAAGAATSGAKEEDASVSVALAAVGGSEAERMEEVGDDDDDGDSEGGNTRNATNGKGKWEMLAFKARSLLALLPAPILGLRCCILIVSLEGHWLVTCEIFGCEQ